MRNIKLVLEYDGTAFVGWQTQAKGRNVQGEITKVLEQILQEKISLSGAGRTDSGVHARGQVANFRLQSDRDTTAIQKALNGILPDDIRVLRVEDVPMEFHARFDARARIYTYAISTEPRSIGRQYHWYVKYPLNIKAMETAAEGILGEHGFESFCTCAAEVDDFRCTVTTSHWAGRTGELVYTVRANRFVHGMVRALVGTMVDIGRGHTPGAEFQTILNARNRSAAGMAAPSRGLCLEEVVY